MTGDDIWDEHRWEQFLHENDRRVDHFMGHLYGFISRNPTPPQDDPEAIQRWEADLRAFLTAKGWPFDEEANFDLFTDNLTDEDAAGLDVYDEFDEEFDDLFDEPPEPDVYHKASSLADFVLAWTNTLPGRARDSTLVHFCTQVTQIGANIAKGHGIGYEQDAIGGNIACAKRGLAAANSALELLTELRADVGMADAAYLKLYEQVFEVRNALGLYIQELRSRFDLGID